MSASALIDLMQTIDEQLAHVWMVRAFLKHSEEAAEDDELAEVHRELYDYMLALGGPLKDGDAEEYLKLARKKLAKLRRASDQFLRIQPEISEHTNFKMAAASLAAAVREVERLLAGGGTERRSAGAAEGQREGGTGDGGPRGTIV
jgi:cob(I)alamin adenosyltransferase